MGLCGLISELIVGACCVLGVTFTILFMTTCEFIKIEKNNRNGSIGLYEWKFIGSGNCREYNDDDVDAALKCAQVCAGLALIMGVILIVFGFFQQCLCPLPCSQFMMDLSGGTIQIFLALVYVAYQTQQCDDSKCTAGEGTDYLILAELSWLTAAIFTRSMRPGRLERIKERREDRKDGDLEEPLTN